MYSYCIPLVEVLGSYSEPELALVIGPHFSLEGFLPTLCKFTHFMFVLYLYFTRHM